MKIIKHSKSTQMFECNECGCIFEADGDEYEQVRVENLGICLKYAKCPECGKYTAMLFKIHHETVTCGGKYYIEGTGQEYHGPHYITEGIGILDDHGNRIVLR